MSDAGEWGWNCPPSTYASAAFHLLDTFSPPRTWTITPDQARDRLE